MRKTVLAALLFLLPALAAGSAPGSPPQCTAEPDPDATGASTQPTATPAPAWAAKFRRDADAVLAGDDFHQTKTSRHLVQRDWLRRWLQNDHEARPASPLPFSLTIVAAVVKWVLAALLILALVWLLWRGWQWLAPRAGQRRDRRPWQAAQEATSLRFAPEDLPDAISAVAREAWARGDGVLALSLLYRGAVQGLAAHYRIELPASATEGECLRIARRSRQAVVTEGFAPIVRAWMALAYARRAPNDFEQLAQLFERHFAIRAEGRP